ncbi:MAG: leucyl aminopeptidase [Brevinematia bacterium]
MKISVKQVSEVRGEFFDAVVVFSFEGKKVRRVFDNSLTKIVSEIVEREKFSSKFGELLVVYKYKLPRSLRFNKIVILGAGKEEKFDSEALRKLGSVISKNAEKYNYSSVVVTDGWALKKLDYSLAFRALVEGLILGTYKFDRFMSKKEEDGKKVELREAVILRRGGSVGFEEVVDKVKVVAESVFLARDLQNLPSNVATPSYIANIAKEECEKVGVRVKVIGRDEAESMGMNLFLAVARGSEEEPKFVVMEYEGGGDKWYGILGKGITFDTGGISLKPSEKMEEMKFDMSGAACIIATIIAIAKLKLKVNVVGITPLTENMPGGRATKPGDIVRGMGGIYVEIVNTDAEGRLILADALEYVKRYKPEFVIDVATLTGACMVALGYEAAGLMGNDDQLKRIIKSSSERTFERVWELPLWDEYEEYIKSNFADVKNVGNRYGGAITAAMFLKKFVDYKWAHLDIAGTAFSDKEKYYISKGGTGFGVRLLLDIFENLEK